MKSFERRQEFFSIINKMWFIFSSAVILEGHEREYEEYIELKDRAGELLSEESKEEVFS